MEASSTQLQPLSFFSFKPVVCLCCATPGNQSRYEISCCLCCSQIFLKINWTVYNWRFLFRRPVFVSFWVFFFLVCSTMPPPLEEIPPPHRKLLMQLAPHRITSSRINCDLTICDRGMHCISLFFPLSEYKANSVLPPARILELSPPSFPLPSPPKKKRERKRVNLTWDFGTVISS